MAAHDKHAPWSDQVIHLEDQPGRAVCWRHPTNWRLDRKVRVFKFQAFFTASFDLCFPYRLTHKTDTVFLG